jgi:hypothetical protein
MYICYSCNICLRHRSEALCMYDSASGATVSKGVIGSEMTTLAVNAANSTTVAAAQSGGEIVLLRPVWA